MLVVVFATGCASSAFKHAKDADTAQAYRSYLSSYPKDSNAEAAELRLTELDFAEAQTQHTVLAYRRFLEHHPDAPQGDSARALIEGLHYLAAKESGRSEAWRQFLQEHPDGAHHTEAEKALGDAARAEVARTENPAQLSERIQRHPELRTPEVDQKLDEAAFTRAKSSGAGKLLEYLDTFPAGAHREDVRLELLSLRLQGLIFSGLLTEARGELERSPLAGKLKSFDARFAEAERFRLLDHAREPLAQSARPQHYLRELPDLIRAADAPDPLDRWEAVEEMGQHLSVAAIDPLLRAFRQGRNPLIRERAFDSLANIVRGLPQPVAEYELATRLKGLKATASSAELYSVLGALQDLEGSLDEAAQSYQRAYDPQNPDPVVLWRWTQIRQERRQTFSSAVAARQLSLWARELADTLDGSGGTATFSLGTARELCAAYQNAVFAEGVLRQASQSKTEFPEDVAQFVQLGTEARRLAEARLKDAELALRTRDASVRTCQDPSVRERLRMATQDRSAALLLLPQRLPKLAPLLLSWAEQHDPSPSVRAQVKAELAGRR